MRFFSKEEHDAHYCDKALTKEDEPYHAVIYADSYLNPDPNPTYDLIYGIRDYFFEHPKETGIIIEFTIDEIEHLANNFGNCLKEYNDKYKEN